MASCYDYVQTQCYRMAPGALKDLKYLTMGFGKKYLIVTACGPITEKVMADITDSFEKTLEQNAREFTNVLGTKGGLACTLPHENIDEVRIEYKFLDYEGVQVTYDNAKKLSEEIKAFGADVIVAVGGGKALDLARASTYYIGCYFRPRIVLCPTALASNACASGLSIIYNEDGSEIMDFWNLHQYPDAVIIDTEIIANAPARIMAAGIGDQISSYWEGIYTIKDKDVWDSIDRIGRLHQDACLEVLLKYSVEAVESVKRKEVTMALESIISCVSFMSGPFMAIGGAFLSHVLDEALIEFEGPRKLLHGEVVGYGVLPQFCYVGTPDMMYEYVDLYQQIGIPCTLAELGMPDATYLDVFEACERTSSKAMAGLSYHKCNPADMAKAVMDAEKLVCEYLAKK